MAVRTVRRSETRRPRSARKPARKRTSRSFPNSDGWKRKKETSIHRLEPRGAHPPGSRGNAPAVGGPGPRRRSELAEVVPEAPEGGGARGGAAVAAVLDQRADDDRRLVVGAPAAPPRLVEDPAEAGHRDDLL